MAEKNIEFISGKHEAFYMEKLEQAKDSGKKADAYRKALYYCLGMNAETRCNFDRIFDEGSGCVKPECLREGWQTGGSLKVVRMAFNLFCNGTPSVHLKEQETEQLEECQRYTVEELFSTGYAPFFWQAVQLRYPEYATYNRQLQELFGSED